MSELKDRFIILKKIKFGEADLIIHALSTQGAKKSFIARSALKSKKRFGGGILEPTHFVLLTYKEAKSEGGLSVLNDFFLNCAGHVALEGDHDSQFLFNLIGHSLRTLGTTKNILRFKLHFCLKFLYQQGVISIDEWMNVFLKENLANSDQLDEIPQMKTIVEDYLDSIESQVLQYLKTADNAGSVY